MITITGNVFDSRSKLPGGGYEKIPSAKVFISDPNGYMTPKKIVATTDSEGRFKLTLPSMVLQGVPFPMIDGTHLTASAPAGNTGVKKVTERISSKSVYDLDISKSGFDRSIEEITVKRPKPVAPEVKTKPWKYFLVGGLLLLAITTGVIIYNKTKK